MYVSTLNIESLDDQSLNRIHSNNSVGTWRPRYLLEVVYIIVRYVDHFFHLCHKFTKSKSQISVC